MFNMFLGHEVIPFFPFPDITDIVRVSTNGLAKHPLTLLAGKQAYNKDQTADSARFPFSFLYNFGYIN